MYVALPADCRRIAERCGYFFDCAAKIALRLSGTVEALKFTEGHCRQNCPGPGAEILRRNVLASNFFEIVIHVGRCDVLAIALFIDVLEQLLPGQLLTSLDDLRDAPVPHA